MEISLDGIDQNCDGVDGEDVDGDGQASLESGGQDCDDNDILTYFGIASSESIQDCYRDADGDGFGDKFPTNENVSVGSDCNDDNTNTFPELPKWIQRQLV